MNQRSKNCNNKNDISLPEDTLAVLLSDKIVVKELPFGATKFSSVALLTNVSVLSLVLVVILATFSVDVEVATAKMQCYIIEMEL